MANIFDGLVVVDMTNNLAGPNTASFLADFGAEVIKVEKRGGDDSRKWPPFIEGISVTSMYINRGKKSLILDISKPEGMDGLKTLIKKADVVVESFRPGVMKRLGLAYEDLIKIKPDIIMCSVSGFGQTGPKSQKPGYDLIAQALSGFTSVNGLKGGPPIKAATAVGDWTGSMNAFAAISAALYYRAKTGEGQYIDISLLDGLVAINEYTEPAFNGFPVAKRVGNHQAYLCPYGIFQGKNGEIVIATANDKLWQKFCVLMKKEEFINDPLFSTNGKRAQNQEMLIPIIESWLKAYDNVDELVSMLDENGIPCCKVNNMDDLLNDQHLIARGMIADMEAPAIPAGKIKSRGVAIKFSKTPGKIRATPALGQHSEEVLKNIAGYDEKKIAEMKIKGILG
jgi:crotonobetainyl-CoA:carnitine CoA-transferase CaiB-like acyl-CoA transferase